MDNLYYSQNNLDSSSTGSSPSPLSSCSYNNEFNLQNDSQFNLDDLLLENWSTPSCESLEANNQTLIVNNEATKNTSFNNTSVNHFSFQMTDTDSDSGLGLSSNSNSPKYSDNFNLIDSNSIDFSSFLPVTELNLNQTNKTHNEEENEYLNLCDLNLETNDTESLLNNIEEMLKSMENQTENDQLKTERILNQKNILKQLRVKKQQLIKDEPLESTKSGQIFKKIIPKTPQNQVSHTQQILIPSQIPVITVPSQTKKINTTHQPLTVLTTIPTVNCSPIIITSTQSSEQNMITPNTIIIDNSPNPKRFKNDYSKKNNSSVLKNDIQKPQTIQFVSQPSVLLTQNNLANSNNQMDPELLKKQSRMIKNRESACLSRKRKKEYMQNLEDNLKLINQKNQDLIKENEQLKQQLKALEDENKLLKQQNFKPVETNKPKIQFTTVKINPSLINNSTNLVAIKPVLNSAQNSSSSLKRPFVMLAVFFIFGLNILQFIDLNGNQSDSNPLQVYNKYQNIYTDKEAAQFAALASASAKDGALVDKAIFSSRKLLSDLDYETEIVTEKKIKNLNINNKTKNSQNFTKTDNSEAKNYNLTRNDSMELVLINGTWHLIDLNICYQKMFNYQTSYNYTHVKKINNELIGWFERHESLYNSQSPKQNTNLNDKFSSYLLKNLNNKMNNQQETKLGKENIIPKKDLNQNKKEYPLSLYDNQNIKYESFAKSVRERNDTFYYVSFRRDHVMLPALIQNKTQRPKMSFILPALLTPGHNSSNDTNNRQQVAFIKIDCEVLDAKLFNININDIPLNYMKIIHQDFLMNQPGSDSYKNYF